MGNSLIRESTGKRNTSASVWRVCSPRKQEIISHEIVYLLFGGLHVSLRETSKLQLSQRVADTLWPP